MTSHSKQIENPFLKESLNIVILGVCGVGKSSLVVQRFYDCNLQEYEPTLDKPYTRDMTVDGHALELSFTETSVQDEYPAMRNQYMRSGQAFLLVYAINNRESFDVIDGFVQQIKHVKEGSPAALVLCGNKTDLASERVVSIEEGKRLAQKLDCPFVETSANTGKNVQDAFTTLCRCGLHYLRLAHCPNDNSQSKNKCVIC